jgi:hypothetical protein
MSVLYRIPLELGWHLTCACEPFPWSVQSSLRQTRTTLRTRRSSIVPDQADLPCSLCSCISPSDPSCAYHRGSDRDRACDGESFSSSLDREWQALWLSVEVWEDRSCGYCEEVEFRVVVAVVTQSYWFTRLLRKLMQPAWIF